MQWRLSTSKSASIVPRSAKATFLIVAAWGRM